MRRNLDNFAIWEVNDAATYVSLAIVASYCNYWQLTLFVLSCERDFHRDQHVTKREISCGNFFISSPSVFSNRIQFLLQ
jgi:hypothetical protein